MSTAKIHRHAFEDAMTDQSQVQAFSVSGDTTNPLARVVSSVFERTPGPGI
jgi:hypothetical protein